MAILQKLGKLVKNFSVAPLVIGMLLFSGFVHAQTTGGWGGGTESPAALGVDRGPLPEEQAFRVEAIKNNQGLLVRMTPATGYYIYQARTTFEDSTGKAPQAQWPKGEIHDDPHFGPTLIHRAQIEVQLLGKPTSSIKIDFQGCQDKGICYPPMSRTLSLDSSQPTKQIATSAPTGGLPLSTSVPAAQPGTHKTIEMAEDQRWASWLTDKAPVWAIGAFFLVGLGLSMTPCVLPMVPVVVGLVAPAHKNGQNAFLMVVYYVLAHAGVLAMVGAIGGSMGGGAGLVQKLQTPFWLIMGASSFIILGAWQAGWVGHRWGSGLTMRVSRYMDRVPQGRAWGAAALGAASALILGPCVAPAAAGALLYVVNSGSVALGAAVLFSMGIGMGVPMLLLAAGGGRLLPTAGPWMEQMTKVGAMALLGVAALLLDRATGQQWPWAWLIAWAMALTCLWAPPRVQTYLKTAAAVMVVATIGFSMRPPVASSIHTNSIAFETVKAAELIGRLKAGQSVMLDLSADWCTSCLTMEKTTFSDPGVISALGSLVPLRLNLDEIDEDEQSFLKQHGLIGPPAILFFDKNGSEMRGARLVGPENPAAFQLRLRKIAN